jgi:DNA-binding Lrp family transcriptional regulator
VLAICQLGWQNARMDQIDATLIRLLRENARLSVSALAGACSVSRGTVQNRIDRLLRDGVIQGFTIRQSAAATPGVVRAVTMLEVGGGKLPQVVRALRGLPEVAELHTTNGRWDLVVDLAAESLAAFDAVLRRIRLIDGITNSETSLKLSDKV